MKKQDLIRELLRMPSSDLKQLSKYFGFLVTKQTGGYLSKQDMVWNLVGGRYSWGASDSAKRLNHQFVDLNDGEGFKQINNVRGSQLLGFGQSKFLIGNKWQGLNEHQRKAVVPQYPSRRTKQTGGRRKTQTPQPKMKLDCILTAVNENPLYMDFIPFFIRAWNELYPEVDVKIVLIANKIPEEYLHYKDNIILFEPIQNVLTSYTSQIIRLFYPCILNYSNGVMITDIDMIPMNRSYYTDNIKIYDNNKFIYFRENELFQSKQIAMCYNVANPTIWKEIFGIHSVEDIKNRIIHINENNVILEGHGNRGWSTDQVVLYDKVMAWNKKTNQLICLKESDTGYNRLNRSSSFEINDSIVQNIKSGIYTDYHCLRPMKRYSDINYKILNLLTNKYLKLKFVKSNLKSPIGNGMFDIFINTKENIIYKKNKMKIKNIKKYKKIIYGIKSDIILHKYVFEPDKIYIEEDGSYYSSFIKNGIRLYDINLNSKIDDTVLDNLNKSIKDMKKKLNNYVKTNKLSGDWALHNLIYCLDTKKIYNVDLEGFYTYPLIHDNGNCNIKYCNERFDKLLCKLEKFNSKRFVIQINNLVYSSDENKFIYKSDIQNIDNYISNFQINNLDYTFTKIIENPVLIINSLDECYAHAVIDRVFPYFWSLQELNIRNNLIIFIKKDKLIKFPARKKVINHEKGIYKKSWNDIINLLNPKEIIFEHLLDENTILLFKKSYLYAENNKKLRWQRTFWNCNEYYPGRSYMKKDVIYDDTIIQSKLNLFIQSVKNKYQIVEKNNNIKNLVIIERVSNRKFDTKFLSNLDNYCKKLDNLEYNGIQFLENLSFSEQIKLFNKNDIIIFRHGSCLTNILWAKQNTIIIELDNQNRESVIKRICDFTKTIQVRYDYNNILNKPNLIFHKIKEITAQDKINDEYFTLILWNPTLFQSEKILQNIPNIIDKKEIIVPKEILHGYIFDIYKLDTRCSHNIVLPPKIKKLREYNDKHLIVKFKIDNPQYTNKICNQAVKLKEMIRNKYKSNIKNYIKDIIIHIADNFEQSKYIWEKNIDNLNILKLLVQEAKNPLRYKLSKIENSGKDGWNTINTMNVYESFVDDTIQFFVYTISNPRRYCLSKEKITDNNWEYCYDFYCKESEVDKRIPMYKTINKDEEKIKKDKIAICFSGQLRTFNKTYKSFYKNIVDVLKDKFEVDIFMFIWKTENKDNIEKALKIYKPKRYIIKDDFEFKLPYFCENMYFYKGRFGNITKNFGNNIKQYYGVAECFNLIENNHYDYVIRNRYDNFFEEKIDITTFDNNLYIPTGHYFYLNGNPTNMNDSFAYGPYNLMKKYSNFINTYKDILLQIKNRELTDHYSYLYNAITPTLLFKYFISHTEKILYKEIKIKYGLLRNDNSLTKFVNNQNYIYDGTLYKIS